MSSMILEYIKSHKNTWEDDLKERNISISKRLDLALFSVVGKIDKNDPLCLEANGLILDLDQMQVACQPLERSSFDQVLQFRLYWHDNGWRAASKSCFRLREEAMTDNEKAMNRILHKSTQNREIPFVTLNIDFTYVFGISESGSPVFLYAIENETSQKYVRPQQKIMIQAAA